jgi:eukaryotic-like serine/threonine-protein kinase
MFPQIFGKYVLERELASGGMARVFLATLRGAGGFEKRLVVKQIRPELASDQSFIQRFVAEAKTTVELSHANIVPVYELGAEQGIYYIAMELCAGVTLAELLASGTVTPSEGAYIGVEICRALDYAHRKASVVHRDVTPRNVMIDAEGMVRLIDFGIAAPASAGSSQGPLFGSLGHMPPEQLRPGPLTPAADVFAVAVLLIEAWTGRAPFRRESLEASTRALGEPLPPLADSDPALAPLEPLIASALAHAPERRPQTAEELARPLREFLRQNDLGDIARRLGERVSERMRQLAPCALDASSVSSGGPLSGASGPSAAQAASVAAAAERGTQTFATRDVAFEWTAKIESAPPRSAAGAGAETQEIESGVVAPSKPGTARAAAVRFRLRVAAVALAASTLVLLGLAHLWTPPSAPRDVARNARAGAIAALPALAPLASVLAAAKGAAPGAIATNDGVTGDAVTSETDPGASDTVATAVRPDNDTNGSEPPPAASRSGAPVEPPTPALTAAPPRNGSKTSGGSEHAERDDRARTNGAPTARVELTADPVAWVEVDGVRVGRTPLRQLSLSAGRHRLAFVSPLLGERLDASVSAAPNTTLSVHADFTSASPRVYVR